MLLEPPKHKNPEISFGLSQLVPIYGEPTPDTEWILKVSALYRQEVFSEFHLETRCAQVFMVGNKQVYAGVLGRNPNIGSGIV